MKSDIIFKLSSIRVFGVEWGGAVWTQTRNDESKSQQLKIFINQKLAGGQNKGLAGGLVRARKS